MKILYTIATIMITIYIASVKSVRGEIVENIAITKHNLSASSAADVHALNPDQGGTDEICVFCHIPHTANDQGPLWNRNFSSAPYNMYDNNTSKSFEASLVNNGAPTGYSKLCLSCHDGSIAIGNIINAPGSGRYSLNNPGEVIKMGINDPNIGFYYVPDLTMPAGSGASTGDTRRLGTNLTNDHPISLIMDNNLVNNDGELVIPDNSLPPSQSWSSYLGVKRYPRDFGSPLPPDAVQCTSCHNPHTVTYPKFLRAPRFNRAVETFYLPGDPNPRTTPTPDPNNPDSEKIICLVCHNKDIHGWTDSAHDKSIAIHNKYPTDVNPYDFDGTHTVGEYACRNCHDPHTVEGAERLHREGVDASGKESTENTCFLCHSPKNTVNDLNNKPFVAGPNTGFVNAADPPTAADNTLVAPDIYSQFAKDTNGSGSGNGSAMNLTTGTGHQPVFIKRPAEGVELMGSVNPPNKYNMSSDTIHIECVDCHNPHQVTGSNYKPAADPNPNRLKGMKGININAGVVGKEGATEITDRREPLVYEICFRCHGNSYSNIFPAGSRFPDDVTAVPRPNRTPPEPDANLRTVKKSIRSDPTYGSLGNNFSFKGFSNKRLEFSPYDGGLQADGSNFSLITSGANAGVDPLRGPYYYSVKTNQPIYKAFHPVAVRGRNHGVPDSKLVVDGTLSTQNTFTTWLINKDWLNDSYNVLLTNPAGQLLGGLDPDHTIICTDCHNTDSIGDIKGPVTVSRGDDDPALIHPQTGASARNDINPMADPAFQNIEYNPSTAIGPHGSNNIRILRGNYYTDVRNWRGHKHSVTGTQEFELCFRCHDYNVWITGAGKTNFRGTFTGTGTKWAGNLHKLHVINAGAHCHDCHMNVHSNVQAENTIYGQDPENSSLGGEAPPDGNTHLINFNPVSVSGYRSKKPRWYWDPLAFGSEGAFRCSLRCHDETMEECRYGGWSLTTDCAVNPG